MVAFFCWSSSKELYILRQQPKVLYNKVVWFIIGVYTALDGFFGEISGSLRLFIILYIKISIDNYEDSIHPPAQGRWFSLIRLINYFAQLLDKQATWTNDYLLSSIKSAF